MFNFYGVDFMKKFLIVLVLCLLVVGTSFSQKVFKEGISNLNLGIGYGFAGIYGDMTIPPISASFDYGASDNVSVGGLIGYTSSEQKYTWGTDEYGWKYSYIVIGVRGAYHFDLGEKFDPYVGGLLGYNVVSVSDIGTAPYGYSASGSFMAFGFYLGGRYYVSDNLALFGELGYGVGYINAGVSFKF